MPPKDDSSGAAGKRQQAASERETLASMPAWRRIEALRERRALKNALTDIWSDDPELDDDIFFPDADGSGGYYRKLNEVDSGEEEVLEDSADPEDD